ncbi:DUF2254 domain-containing protein [Octadecabacter sp.]|nr:DUF2254 domain-containing protein [Octadecabacter sp.]
MSRRAFVKKLVEDVQASYWFIPTVLAVAATVIAQATLYIDNAHTPLPETWRSTNIEAARATLSVISQSMIGVAGVMFSMTIVAVSFASGNFGPRLIGNFMRDRGNQWSLGILIATFIYSLLILRAVDSPMGGNSGTDAFVPHLSLLVSFVLTAMSIAAMIFYVHHIPETINVSNISADLGKRLRQSVVARIAAQDDDVDDADISFPDRSADATITLTSDGYLQRWDRDQLVKIAQDHDVLIEVEFGAGDFVTQYSPIVSIWGTRDIDDDLRSAVRDSFAVGESPTERQNLLFIVEQLVEMIARALSPGVNDPYTAINCLNWLYTGLVTAATHGDGLHPRPQGRVRYPIVDFSRLLEVSVTLAAPYILVDDMTRAHLDGLLERLMKEVDDADVREKIANLQKGLASS